MLRERLEATLHFVARQIRSGRKVFNDMFAERISALNLGSSSVHMF